jgi:hypothetical protein
MAADKEIMKAIERLRLDRPGRMHRSYRDGAKDLGLSELAATYREEAELWAKSGAKGWKGSEAENYLLSTAIDTVAAQLDNAGGGAALSVSERAPVGQTEPATTHERLDDFVASAVAAGKGALRPASNEWPREADGSPVPGDASDVAAYLKGEIDTLPGLAEALVPNSITRQADTDNPYASAEDVIDAAGLVLDPNGSEHGPDDRNYSRLPKTWESDTMTADGHRPPGVSQAPTLGQPGDMGTGYSHAYVPVGGRKLTYADLLTPVPAVSLPPHLSHSQGDTIGDCATKYRLQRVEQLPQIPQWANIGGTAFHAAVEAFERTVHGMPVDKAQSNGWANYDVETVWKHHFEQTIAAVAATTAVPISVWRAARKGAEGEQWWRVNGPQMLRRYLDARPSDVTWAPVGEQAIELDRTVGVPTNYGPIPFNAKIDRVTISEDGRTLTIRDYKTSYERPTDTTQLGDYAWVLAFADPGMMAAGIEILGSYFDARRGEWTTPVAVLDAHPFEAFQYRVTTAHAQKRALTTGPTPARPSSYCGGCSVRYACPVMSTKN